MLERNRKTEAFLTRVAEVFTEFLNTLLHQQQQGRFRLHRLEHDLDFTESEYDLEAELYVPTRAEPPIPAHHAKLCIVVCTYSAEDDQVRYLLTWNVLQPPERETFEYETPSLTELLRMVQS